MSKAVRSAKRLTAIESPALALLEEVNLDFASSLDVEETLQRTIDRIMRHLHVETAAIYLRDELDGSLVCQRCTGPLDLTGGRVAPGEGVIGAVVETGQALRFGGTGEDAGPPAPFGHGRMPGIRSLLCVPLQTRGECMGALQLANKLGRPGEFTVADLDLASAVAAAAALAIQNARMIRNLVDQQRMQREVELAREIQLTLLPQGDAALPVAGLNLPAHRVSGDFFDFQQRPDGRLYFSIADVAGKGMNAALLMAKTISLLRCLSKSAPDPAALLEQVNSEVHETTTGGLFVTIVAGFLDPASGELVYANAGHLPPLARLATGEYEYHSVRAPPLGVRPTLAAPLQRLSVVRGPCYLYTDGVTEARDPAGAGLGLPGLLELLDASESQPLQARLPWLTDRLRAAGRRFHDDLTLLCLAPVVPTETLLRVEVPAASRDLRSLRHELRRVLAGNLRTAPGCEALVVAVNEACMNIIQHAYGGDGCGTIGVDVRLAGQAVDILLRDHAAPVDHRAIAPRDLADLRPGGLGTHFIQSTVDEWQYGHLAGGLGNTLRLVKHLTGGSA